MSERGEFVAFATRSNLTMSALCRRYGVSRKTGYKWLRRAREAGADGLADRSRRPHRSPARTLAEVETAVCGLRAEHPAWGGRKLHHVLRREGFPRPPAPSTITGILRRHGLLAADRRPQRDWQRFEEAQPNALWQMDFKGHFPTGGGRCHPLTILDDHSRFNICLSACADERAETVQEELTNACQRYGLPERLLMDNGSPWGSDQVHPHTRLTAWLIRLGVTMLHGRPYHPQTQGKEERFHRTLELEVLTRRPSWPSLAAGLRSLARRLQPAATARSARAGTAGLPVSAQPAVVPDQAATHRVRSGRSGPAGTGQGAHLFPGPAVARESSLHWRAGRAARRR